MTMIIEFKSMFTRGCGQFEKNFFIVVLLCVLFTTHAFAENKFQKSNRIGVSLGSTGLTSEFNDYDHVGYTSLNFGLLLDYDKLGILPWRHWSLGGEVGLFGYNITLEPRMLWHEKSDMSGFYAGPKLYLSMGRYERTHNARMHVGVGGESGWIHQFRENFDLGVGANLIATEHGFWSNLKITAGYLF